MCWWVGNTSCPVALLIRRIDFPGLYTLPTDVRALTLHIQPQRITTDYELLGY